MKPLVHTVLPHSWRDTKLNCPVAAPIIAESLCVEVAGQVLQRYGKKLTCAAHKAALGKRPLECWRDVAAILGLDVPAQKLFDDSEPLLRAK